MARLPSGVKATCVTLSPNATVSSTFTSVPLTESTLIVPSARLVTSARLPAALKLSLLADGYRCCQLRRISLEVDDIDLVVRHYLECVAVLGYVHRICNQSHRPSRIDVEIHGRPGDGVFERKVRDDFGVFRIGEIDD